MVRPQFPAFPCYDGNGNVTDLVGDDGTIVAHYEYDPFGQLKSQVSSRSPDPNPFRFSTKYTDPETGLLYYGYRYYSPGLGRWINRDPIGERGGINVYGFVGNEPVGRWDVLGLSGVAPPNCGPLRVDAATRSFGGSLEVHVDHIKDPIASSQFGPEPGRYVELQGRAGTIATLVSEGCLFYATLYTWTEILSYNSQSGRNADKMQICPQWLGNLTVCGCCPSKRVRVTYRVEAEFTTEGGEQQGGALARFSENRMFVNRLNEPISRSSPTPGPFTEEFDQPEGGCVAIPWSLYTFWVERAAATVESGVHAYTSVSAIVSCAQ